MARAFAVIAIVLAGAALRVTGIGFGDPFAYHPDEWILARPAIGSGSLRPTIRISRLGPPLGALASRVGFEPTTKGLKVPCSTAELPAHERPYHVQIRPSRLAFPLS